MAKPRFGFSSFIVAFLAFGIFGIIAKYSLYIEVFPEDGGLQSLFNTGLSFIIPLVIIVIVLGAVLFLARYICNKKQ